MDTFSILRQFDNLRHSSISSDLRHSECLQSSTLQVQAPEQGFGGTVARCRFSGPSVHWNDGPSAAGGALEMETPRGMVVMVKQQGGYGCFVFCKAFGEKFYGYDRLLYGLFKLFINFERRHYQVEILVKRSPDSPSMTHWERPGGPIFGDSGRVSLCGYPLHSRIPRKLSFKFNRFCICIHELGGAKEVTS